MFEDRAGHEEPYDGPPASSFDSPSPDATPAPSPVSSSAADWAVPGVPRPSAEPVDAADGVPVPVVLPEAVLALQAAAAGLAGWAPTDLDGAQALAAAQVLLEVERQVVAARMRSLADIEGRHLHRLDSASTTGRWLSSHGHEVPAAQLTLARRLAVLPQLADELAAGRVSVAVGQRLQAVLTAARPHLDRPDGLIDGQPGEEALYGVVVNGVRMWCCQARGGYQNDDDPGLLDLVQELLGIYRQPTGQLARLEAGLLVLARQLTVHGALAQLPEALRQLLDSLLPAQLEERVRRRDLDRGLTLTRKHDGSGWRLQGDLDLECGELAFTVLGAELRRDPDAPADTDRAAGLRDRGLDPHDPALELAESARPRSRRERMHDALTRALTRYLAADLGGQHDKTPVRIEVATTTDTLDGRPGAPAAITGSGTTIPTSLVRRWACGSTLTRIALNLAGRVIEVSHTDRTLKAHERQALHTQTGGWCQGRGCRRSTHDPGTIMHPHHTTPWAVTGTTSLTDSVLLCTACHHDLHHRNPLTLKDGRRLGPEGWIE